MGEKNTAAVEMGKKRWAGTTKKQRREAMLALNAKRWAAARKAKGGKA